MPGVRKSEPSFISLHLCAARFFLLCAGLLKQGALRLLGGGLLQRRQDVRVGVERQGDAGVGQPFADDLRVLIRCQQGRGSGATLVLQAEAFGEPGRFQHRLEVEAVERAARGR